VTDKKIPIRRRLHGKLFKLPYMIACDEFEDFIIAYLEGDLSKKQGFVFELHLKMCRECRDYLKAYQASMELAKSALKADDILLQEMVPQDLVEAVITARKA
jgi:predicted anti-sigma-YlaC factor YlaD